jgi:3-hydroxyacyl-[acyl-carrier-protein] dehydratase
MRWMWIDRIVAFEPKARMVAIKNISLSEELLHDHFPAEPGRDALPVFPGSLIIEGMAQTAGILVGSVHDFREKVVLAKVVRGEIDGDVGPGQTIRYDAAIERMDGAGASTIGTVSRFDHRDGVWVDIGRIELLFSHLDRNRQGLELPEENFVFGENFRTILRNAGFERSTPAAGPSGACPSGA